MSSEAQRWVYVHSEHSDDHDLYTVGFYDPHGGWHPEDDYTTEAAAAGRCNYLNGARHPDHEFMLYVHKEMVAALTQAAAALRAAPETAVRNQAIAAADYILTQAARIKTP